MNVKQYYFTKRLHKERIDENTSVLETKQHCEALENQAFQQVKSALAVQSDKTHIVLGSKPARIGPQVDETEDDTWELYKKAAYISLKKAVQSFSATEEKVAAVKQSLAGASEEVQQDPQHQTSLLALGSLQGNASQEREQWQQALQGFQASLDKASEAEVEKALQEAQEAKQECDSQRCAVEGAWPSQAVGKEQKLAQVDEKTA